MTIPQMEGTWGIIGRESNPSCRVCRRTMDDRSLQWLVKFRKHR